MTDELATMDATGQAALVRTGDVSPVELVDAAIERIERCNGQLNAVIRDRFDEARAEARQGPTGPFAGVPILLKDLGAAMGGEPLYSGMRVAKEADYRPPRDSYLVEKLRAAGFVVLGRTNCPELGLTITTEPETYGPTRNPWSLEHTAGGSSGGSAAAVASGMVPVAHGNDGGGSIRIPASNCGLFGLKPSRGRVSSGPEPGELAWGGSTIDHVEARTVRDSAALLDVLAGEMPGDFLVAPAPARPFTAEVGTDPGTLRIAFWDRPVREGFGIHPACAAAVRESVATLESLGHRVAEALPAPLGHPEFEDHFLVLVCTSVVAALAEFGDALGREIRPEELEVGNRLFHEMGAATGGVAYLRAEIWFERWRRELAAFWAEGGYDLLVTPVLAYPPARIGELSDPTEGLRRVLETLQFTPQYNVSGQPAMSVPLGWTDDGLPVGVQFGAAYGREDLLVAVAAQLEQARPWASRRPPLHA